jgi:hypothetical protein
MDDCQITLGELADYLEARLDDADEERLSRHLNSGCGACQQRLAWLERAIDALCAHPERTVPAATLERMQHLFAAWSSRDVCRTLRIARPVFDSHSGQVEGLRGEENTAFQMLFAIADYEIDLWQERLSTSTWYVIGQVAPKYDGPAIRPERVTLTRADGDPLSVVPDHSEFHFACVPGGHYEFRVQFADQEIVIPDVTVGG